MNSSRHSVDLLLNFSLLFSGFEVMLLKKAFAPCLKYEYRFYQALITKRGVRLRGPDNLYYGILIPSQMRLW